MTLYDQIARNKAAFMAEGDDARTALYKACCLARAKFFKAHPGGAIPEWLAFPKGRRLASHYAPNGAPMRAKLEENPKPTRGGLISVNMKQMGRWKVTADNVRFYDAIMQNKGKFHTLDDRPYVDWLNEFNIFYTLSNPKPQADKVRRAKRLAEGFNEAPLNAAETFNLPEFNVGIAPGQILGIIYAPTIAGRPKKLIHWFRKVKSRPLLVVSHDGKQFRSLGGAFRFTSRGFVDE